MTSPSQTAGKQPDTIYAQANRQGEQICQIKTRLVSLRETLLGPVPEADLPEATADHTNVDDQLGASSRVLAQIRNILEELIERV